MTQRYLGDHVPYVPVRLRLNGQPTDLVIEALVDTGFDGDVIVPASYVVGAEARGESTWTLADGSEVLASHYIGNVQLGNLVGSHLVSVTGLGEEALLGRSLMDRFLLTLDHGRSILIEP